MNTIGEPTLTSGNSEQRPPPRAKKDKKSKIKEYTNVLDTEVKICGMT